MKIFHHRLESSKEPFEEVNEDRVVQALEDIIGRSLAFRRLPATHARSLQTRATFRVSGLGSTQRGESWTDHVSAFAVLIHDNKGRLLPSILSALLRLMNRWSFTSVLAEYRSFLPDEKVWAEGEVGKPDKGRERMADLEVSPGGATLTARC